MYFLIPNAYFYILYGSTIISSLNKNWMPLSYKATSSPFYFLLLQNQLMNHNLFCPIINAVHVKYYPHDDRLFAIFAADIRKFRISETSSISPSAKIFS